MQIITKKQFNSLTGKHIFRIPFYNKLAELPKSKGLLIEIGEKYKNRPYCASSRVSKVLGRKFIIKKTLDKKNYAILRIK